MPKKRPARRTLWKVQRAIVLQLLRDDHEPLWTRSELKDEMSDFSRRAFGLALELLEGDECIAFVGSGGVRASICAQHLDELGLIGV